MWGRRVVLPESDDDALTITYALVFTMAWSSGAARVGSLLRGKSRHMRFDQPPASMERICFTLHCSRQAVVSIVLVGCGLCLVYWGLLVYDSQSRVWGALSGETDQDAGDWKGRTKCDVDLLAIQSIDTDREARDVIRCKGNDNCNIVKASISGINIGTRDPGNNRTIPSDHGEKQDKSMAKPRVKTDKSLGALRRNPPTAKPPKRNNWSKRKYTPEIPVRPHYKNATKVLLVTYMRSGSSFFGELFNQNPDVFYVFEPLASVFDVQANDSRNWFMHDNLTNRQYTSEQTDAWLQFVINSFECRLQHLPVSFLMDRFVLNGKWKKSLKMNSYRDCIREKKRIEEIDFPDVAVDCMPVMREECRASPARVMKTIRMRMDVIRDLLAIYPGINIVHQIRDPRAILNSRWLSSIDHREADFLRDTDLLCQQMIYDLKIRRELEARYPGQIYQQRYEDMVISPHYNTRDLYQALSLGSTPPDVAFWIKENTNAEEDNGQLGTARRNASVLIDQWTETLPRDMLVEMTHRCKTVLEMYDYETENFSYL